MATRRSSLKHPLKVLSALESVAAAASSPADAAGSATTEGSGGIPSSSNSGGPVATASSNTAVIVLEKVEKDAVLTVKEVSKVGPIKLATVTLPSMGHEVRFLTWCSERYTSTTDPGSFLLISGALVSMF